MDISKLVGGFIVAVFITMLSCIVWLAISDPRAMSSSSSDSSTGTVRPYVSMTGKSSGIGIDMGGNMYMDMNGNLNIGIGF